MSYYRKVLSVDNDMLFNRETNTAILFVNQRTGARRVTKKPVVLRGTTPNRLFLKIRHYIERSHAPVE